MDIDYGNGKTGRVVVGADTRKATVDRADLKPGSNVNAMTTTGADGKPAANMIMLVPAGAQSRQ